MKNTNAKTRKLALNKETIRNLSERQLESVAGGMLSSYARCICSASIYEDLHCTAR